jgi:hypothetical protein
VELEGLTLGVAGKQAMWAVMNEAYGRHPRLSGVDLLQLYVRARDQRRVLDDLRQRAAIEALT